MCFSHLLFTHKSTFLPKNVATTSLHGLGFATQTGMETIRPNENSIPDISVII